MLFVVVKIPVLLRDSERVVPKRGEIEHPLNRIGMRVTDDNQRRSCSRDSDIEQVGVGDQKPERSFRDSILSPLPLQRRLTTLLAPRVGGSKHVWVVRADTPEESKQSTISRCLAQTLLDGIESRSFSAAVDLKPSEPTPSPSIEAGPLSLKGGRDRCDVRRLVDSRRMELGG